MTDLAGKPWAVGEDALFKELGGGREGLSAAEAERRLNVFGRNELERGESVGVLDILLSQFKDFLVVILISAAVVSAFIGVVENSSDELIEAVAILVVIVFIVVVGFIQEYKAEREMEALRNMVSPSAVVVRGGRVKRIDAGALVAGDVIRIEAGDRIPADARVIDSINLKVDESILTGESIPVNKSNRLLEADSVLADRSNMLYMATSATYGKCTALVSSTGMSTELGKIASRIQEIEKEKTPLQKNLDRAGKQIGVIVLFLCALIFVTGLVNGVNTVTMFLTAVSLAVAAVPEGLPAVVTITLARGMRRMVKRNSLVRKLTAVETLGAITVICTDKTGTLTKNEMTVRRVYVGGKVLTVSGEGYAPAGGFLYDGVGVDSSVEGLRPLLRAAALCNDASLDELDGVWTITGDPTEACLLVAAEKAGISLDELSEEYPRVYEVPFTSERKRMATVHESPSGGRILYMKGAPDVILDLCGYVLDEGGGRRLTGEVKREILGVCDGFAEDALRLIGCAYRRLDVGEELEEEALERDLVFVGLMGLIDPPRDGVRESIELCRGAGIEPVMITGDHALTAKAVAREIGLFEEGDVVVSGRDIDSMGPGVLRRRVGGIRIYARTNPEHKLRIVSALKEEGHVVAMTGDGVNDAPALKKSDIGVAMGVTGTDVSKEAADMVLLDDNFSSIVAAVEEGRGIYDNILLFIKYLLSCNIGEVLTVFLVVASLMVFGESPLLPLQILWMNFLTDAAPALALGFNPPDPDVMRRRPRDPAEGIISRGGLIRFIGIGSLMCIGTVSLFYLSLPVDIGLFAGGGGLDDALMKPRTIAFTTLVMFQMFYVLSCRSNRHPFFRVGVLSNRYLVAAVVLSVLLQVFVVHLDVVAGVFGGVGVLGPVFSFMLDAFGTTSLSLGEWAVIVVVSSTAFILPELFKLRGGGRGSSASLKM